MPQSLEAFRLFFSFADTLAARTGLAADDLVWQYTPLPKSLGRVASTFQPALRAARDKAAFAHAQYLSDIGPDPRLGDETFHGHKLFGPFYYELRDNGKTIRPHLAKLQPYNDSPLGHPETSRTQLKEMFAHIRKTEPQATTVLGNSWLYNLSAYRAFYPPAFTAPPAGLPAATPAVSTEPEFQHLALWGQFFTRHWQVKPHFATQLRNAIAKMDGIENLRLCFPYQVLTPSSPIDVFFAHYGV